MAGQVKLVHAADESVAGTIPEAGLKAMSAFDDLDLEMRRCVVFCWLRKDDDKLSSAERQEHRAYFEVSVHEDRCRVADMDLASVAMMYRQGTRKPKNADQAARLLADAYRITSVPLAEYESGMFWTPEVLVRGDIGPECIRRLPD